MTSKQDLQDMQNRISGTTTQKTADNAAEDKIQTIYGNIPSKSNNCYVINNRIIKSAAVRKYEADFYIQCNLYRNKNIQGYFELHAKVYFPSQRNDLDNFLKVFMDCLQHCKAIKNDNKMIKVVAEKYLDKLNPRIEFELVEI